MINYQTAEYCMYKVECPSGMLYGHNENYTLTFSLTKNTKEYEIYEELLKNPEKEALCIFIAIYMNFCYKMEFTPNTIVGDEEGIEEDIDEQYGDEETDNISSLEDYKYLHYLIQHDDANNSGTSVLYTKLPQAHAVQVLSEFDDTQVDLWLNAMRTGVDWISELVDKVSLLSVKYDSPWTD